MLFVRPSIQCYIWAIEFACISGVVHVSVCLCLFISVGVGVCMTCMLCMWRAADSLQLAVLSFPPHLSQGLFAAVWARLAGLRACIDSPRCFPSPSSACWDCRHTPSCILSLHEFWGSKQVSTQMLLLSYPSSYPSLHQWVFNFKFRFPSVFLSCSILHQLSSDFIQFFDFSWNSLRTLFLSFKFI